MKIPTIQLPVARPLAKIIDAFLRTKNISLPLTDSDFVETDRTVAEAPRFGQNRISPYLINAMSANVSTMSVYHYTKISNFKSIANSGVIRLSNLKHLLKNNEYRTFALLHQLDGVLGNNAENYSYIEDLTEKLHVGSFSIPTKHDEPRMWSNFCDNGTGVRLTMTIERRDFDFREVQYGKSQTILTELNDALRRSNIDKPFLLQGLWRIGAFYLPSALAHEGEIRLLRADISALEAKPYYELKLDGTSPECGIAVTLVEIGANASAQQRNVIIDHAQKQGWPVI